MGKVREREGKGRNDLIVISKNYFFKKKVERKKEGLEKELSSVHLACIRPWI